MWDRIRKRLPDLCTVLLVTLMVMASEITGEKEIIFPEITALAVGYMVAEKRSWMVNSRRMLLLITACAISGVLIVRYMGLSPLAEIIIAFALAQVLFLYSGTTFAPFVSAIVLPVMLRTTTWVYPIAAFILTLSIILLHHLFIRMGLREDAAYVPVLLNKRDDWIDLAIRVLAAAVLGFIAFSIGMKYIIAPPLLVAFTEFSRPRNKTRNKPVKAIAVITGCGLLGPLIRFLVSVTLGLPLTCSAFLTAVGILVIIHRSRMYMPPAGAIAVLAMLIPQEALLLFPLQIFIGSTAVMLISRLLFMTRQDRKAYEQEHELTAN